MSKLEEKAKAIIEERAKDFMFEPDLSDFLGHEDKREKIYQRGFDDAVLEVSKDAQKEIEQWEEAKKAWEKQVSYLLEDIRNLEAKVKVVAEIADQMDDLYATNIQNLEGVRASLFHDYAKKLRASVSQEQLTEKQP